MERKPILEWFRQAKADGYEWADAAIENAINHGIGHIEETSISEALLNGFAWHDTQQGFKHWNYIHENLLLSGK